MSTRTAALCCVIVFGFTSSPAHAQGVRGGCPPGVFWCQSQGQVIQSLAADLAALQARVAKLESGEVTEDDLVGRYHLQMLGVEMGVNPYIATETSSATFVLHANRTVEVLSVNDGRCKLHYAPLSMTCGLEPGDEDPTTWSLEGGNFVLRDEGGELALSLPVGGSGRMMIFGETSEFLTGHSWSNILIAIRLPNQ